MPRQPHDPRRSAPPGLGALAAALLAAAPAAASAADAPAMAPIASEGPDILIGGPQPDTLEGLGGDDLIRGMNGDDEIRGNRGSDSVGGGLGDDHVRGGPGKDQVYGGQGNDTLGGDRDDDTLAGGPGADRFLFDNLSGSDVILDFASVDGDRIELPTGMDYTVADTPEGLTLKLGAGGGRLLLAGVKFSTMGTWLAEPRIVPGPPRHLPVSADPPPAPRKALLAVIVVLSLAFFALLAVGLTQLVREGRKPRL